MDFYSSITLKNKIIIVISLVLTLLFTNSVLIFGQEVNQVELEKLMDDFLSDDFGVSFRVQNDLVQLGEQAIPALSFVYRRDPDPWNRVKVINILRRIDSPKAMELLVSGIEAGITEGNIIVRENAIEAIKKIDNPNKDLAIEYLVPYLNHEKIWVRSTALDLLVTLGMPQEEIALILIDNFKNGKGTSEDIALFELGRLRKTANQVVDELLAELDFEKENQFERSLKILRTITAIADTENKQVQEILFNLLLSSDFDMRQEAIWGMRWIGLSGEEMMKPLISLLTSDSFIKQKLAIEILVQLAITQPAAVKSLMDFAVDENYSKEIQFLAIEGLKSLVPQLEYHIDRGLVAINTEEGNFLSWRLLGTEPADLGFNIYRDGIKINQFPLVGSTNYLDQNGCPTSSYHVTPVVNEQELAASETVSVWEENYLSVPLVKPEGGITPAGDSYVYHANECSVGDLTGNGKYDIVLKWDPSNAKDNAHDGYTGNVYIDAYTLEGEMLWRIDLGRNIRAGAHYTQFMVYDLDGDGKAEIVMKTADGTVDGRGNIIGDPNADYRTDKGRILSGPEYLTVFDGETGEALHTINYKPARGNIEDWGDNYGNRVDRFLAAIAYLDGQKPSVIMARGYYTRTALVAYDFVDGQLKERWVFDTNSDPALKSWEGQGNHQLSVADVDGDGKDEIIYGAMTINHDGTGLYNTGLGHGDALHVSNFDPTRPGLEVFGVHEEVPNDAGINLRDARTGEIIWSYPTDYDVGRGVAANIDPNYPGSETWASGGGLMDVSGNEINRTAPPMCFVIWWDGDLQREVLEYTTISKWDWENKNMKTLLSPQGLGQNRKPLLQADLFGDWREEVIWRANDSSELRIYTTTDLTEHRFYTLMHDRMYRTAIAWQNVAYNQPPHPSFYIGEEMEPQTYNPGLIKSFLEQIK